MCSHFSQQELCQGILLFTLNPDFTAFCFLKRKVKSNLNVALSQSTLYAFYNYWVFLRRISSIFLIKRTLHKKDLHYSDYRITEIRSLNLAHC